MRSWESGTSQLLHTVLLMHFHDFMDKFAPANHRVIELNPTSYRCQFGARKFSQRAPVKSIDTPSKYINDIHSCDRNHVLAGDIFEQFRHFDLMRRISGQKRKTDNVKNEGMESVVNVDRLLSRRTSNPNLQIRKQDQDAGVAAAQDLFWRNRTTYLPLLIGTATTSSYNAIED